MTPSKDDELKMDAFDLIQHQPDLPFLFGACSCGKINVG